MVRGHKQKGSRLQSYAESGGESSYTATKQRLNIHITEHSTANEGKVQASSLHFLTLLPLTFRGLIEMTSLLLSFTLSFFAAVVGLAPLGGPI